MENIKYYGNDKTPLYASTMGSGLPLIMLHGGGPDRNSIIPFAILLQTHYKVIFPDIRGYGQSECFEPRKHTWEQYADDVIALLQSFGYQKAIISGMGLGATIAERFAYTYPEQVLGLILISPESFDENGKGSSPEEIELMEKCAEIARNRGLKEAWKPFKKHLSPVINTMVDGAIPRTNPDSFAAAMAIVHSQRLKDQKLLTKIAAPTLIIPGNDPRHPSDVGKRYTNLVPRCFLGQEIDWQKISSVEELAKNVAPQITNFLAQQLMQLQ